jgi:ABC-type nitrate/sulfonate/bicarbonate transport system substrate-binding protein
MDLRRSTPALSIGVGGSAVNDALLSGNIDVAAWCPG